MEDVLDLYHQDYDPDHPVVCFDKTSRQLVVDKRPAIGAKRHCGGTTAAHRGGTPTPVSGQRV